MKGMKKELEIVKKKVDKLDNDHTRESSVVLVPVYHNLRDSFSR